MNKRISILFISLLLAVITFISLIFVQKKMLAPSGTIDVYYAKVDIDKNTDFTDENFDKYFDKFKINKELLADGAVTDKENLINYYATQNIIKNEQISSKRLEKTAVKMEDIKDKVEYSIKFSDIGEVVGGTLKEGDIIDLILTEKNQSTNKITTRTELKNLLISKTFSADGMRIRREESNKPSMTLNLMISADEAHILDNAIARGKLKALKKIDNSNYDDVIIEN